MRMAYARFLRVILLGCGIASCENSGTERDFERMVNQSYFQYYEKTDFFADGRAMREPPRGAVPAELHSLPPAMEKGMVDNQYVAQNPVLLTPALLRRGQSRFDTFCAPCHGVLGDGASVVAHKMELRKPRSLVASPITQFPDGRIFSVITDGYGLMPSYSRQLPVVDCWAIVAYVRALGIHAAGVSIDRLPESIRSTVEETLR